MIISIKFIVLAALIRLLIASDQPFLCSGIYAAGAFFLGLAFGHQFVAVLIGTSISFLLASLYFWLLSRTDGAPTAWWVIAIAGILIGLV